MKKVTTLILYMNMNCMKLDSRHSLTKDKYFFLNHFNQSWRIKDSNNDTPMTHVTMMHL